MSLLQRRQRWPLPGLPVTLQRLLPVSPKFLPVPQWVRPAEQTKWKSEPCRALRRPAWCRRRCFPRSDPPALPGPHPVPLGAPEILAFEKCRFGTSAVSCPSLQGLPQLHPGKKGEGSWGVPWIPLFSTSAVCGCRAANRGLAGQVGGAGLIL